MFVLSQALIDYLARQIFLCPSEVFDLDHELRPNPMHAAQYQR
jgi:hypothetical protein